MDVRQHWELLVMLAPDPSEDQLTTMYQSDRMRNPHNDSHKPRIRDRNERILDYKIEFVKMLQEK